MWQEYVQWGIVGLASSALDMWFPSFIQNKRGGGSGHPRIKFPAKKKTHYVQIKVSVGLFPHGCFCFATVKSWVRGTRAKTG